MTGEGGHILLGELMPYKMAVELSDYCWEIYERMDWRERKIIGDQFITAIDSVGANIAEGYGRFHYLDRIKFYYNSRGSLLESKHWALLLRKRGKITEEEFNNLIEKLNKLHYQLNSFIKGCYPNK